MRRTLPWTLLIGLLAAGCAREHGDAPAGTFAPGGVIDERGNAATSRALGGTPPGGTPDGAQDQPSIADRMDAGALGAGFTQEEVRGRIASVGDEQVRIVPEQGAPVTLSLEEGAQVTLGGSLVSTGDLRQGAEVRASFRTDRGGRPVAEEIRVLRTPGEGPGLWQQELEPPGSEAPGQ